MNWGIKITALYLGFVAIILTLVITCFGHKTELEYKDYYSREINFQDQIDATKNANLLEMPITYTLQQKSIKLTIPKTLLQPDLSGQIQFLRPSDANEDKLIPVKVDEEGLQTIQSDFKRGLYKMQITLQSSGKTYYKEAVINFQ